MTPEDFRFASDVSRETMARLQTYADLLVKWQKAINLVSKSTLPDLWQRHMLDSAQLFDIASNIVDENAGKLPPLKDCTWLDLGSGAGFPGLVLAIMGVGHVHLVESDARKGTFMREVARQTGADVTIHTCRIEKLENQKNCPPAVDFISARALAGLEQLMDWSVPFRTQNTVCLFPKGQDVDSELQKLLLSEANKIKKWPSRTNDDSVVVQISATY
jgi:16S rRNA (guanine527-N7)-methyltransferase